MTAENPNFIVELFIKTLELKHKLTFQKDKEEYFRVLFDTYLNGQGNPNELKDYIAAGIQDSNVINIIADQVIQWQGKAEELKAAQMAKKNQKELEKQKINQFVANRTKKLREEAEQERKERGENPRKRHKGEKGKTETKDTKKAEPAPEGAEGAEGAEGEEVAQEEQAAEKGEENKVGLKNVLQKQGKEKCRYYPFCKNLEKCPYFHPSQRCTYFPHCRYGDSCLYEHEACRFREKCNRAQCPYAHPFKALNPLEEIMKKYMNSNNPLSKKKRFHKHNPNHPPKTEGNQEEQPQ